MANPNKRVPTKAPGNIFVNATCINCDTCRPIAPRVFGPGDRRVSLRALLTCPTGSIGDLGGDDVKVMMDDFPLAGEGSVYYKINSPEVLRRGTATSSSTSVATG